MARKSRFLEFSHQRYHLSLNWNPHYKLRNKVSDQNLCVTRWERTSRTESGWNRTVPHYSHQYKFTTYRRGYNSALSMPLCAPQVFTENDLTFNCVRFICWWKNLLTHKYQSDHHDQSHLKLFNSFRMMEVFQLMHFVPFYVNITAFQCNSFFSFKDYFGNKWNKGILKFHLNWLTDLKHAIGLRPQWLLGCNWHCGEPVRKGSHSYAQLAFLINPKDEDSQRDIQLGNDEL